jgi:hypothetical protein
VLRAQENDPQGFESNANVKLFRALSQLIMDVVPSDPARDEYRQGNTLGPAYRHWRRAKIGRRFRLFFRYDSKAKVIVYAWVNDEQTLRSSGSKSDPMRCSRRCWDAATRRTIGTHWCRQASRIGANWNRHSTVAGDDHEHDDPHQHRRTPRPRFGRGWRAYARGERRASNWLVSKGMPLAGATALLWVVKLAALGCCSTPRSGWHCCCWLAVRRLDGRNTDGRRLPEPEWRNGQPDSACIYHGYRIDPHVQDDEQRLFAPH